eukprot:scaffold227_cov165-Amphora_coffeaeformis.AAC.42
MAEIKSRSIHERVDEEAHARRADTNVESILIVATFTRQLDGGFVSHDVVRVQDPKHGCSGS